MEKIISADGTAIATERSGVGEPVILVAAALQGRATYRPLAEELSRSCAVVNYDRRGRGDSGDTPPYAVEREVEDLAALIAEMGGQAALYGHSSGAALVLHAAERGLPISRIVLHEPPFGPGGDEDAEAARFADLLAQGRRAEVIREFLAPTGMPPDVIDHLSQDPAMLANVPTVLYDPYEVMSARSRGGRTPTEQAAEVTVPALVIAGGASPDWMITTARSLGDALPSGETRVLKGEGHVVAPDVLAPILAEFLSG